MLAYLGSWIGWAPWWLSDSGLGLFPYKPSFNVIALINQIGLFTGPFLAAFVVTRIISGKEGVAKLKQSIFQWRLKPLTYLLTLVVLPAILVSSYFIFFGATISPNFTFSSIITIIVTSFVYLIGGPIQEEPGWRGLALLQLQKKYHPLIVALIIGVVHCFWHAPLFLTDEWDTARGDIGQLVAYLILIVSLSVLLSWLTNAAKGSTFAAIIGHNVINWSLFIVATLTATTVTDNWPIAIALGAIATLIIIGTKTQLGYKK